ncbi:MAG TPA: amidohydrolase family protein [Vicinamibacterales bacterium]|nr:amidohydrolase family protein [Vicinamibacterales bacterium]
MRTITLEEHYASPAFMAAPGRGLKEHAQAFTGPRARLLNQLCDVGRGRIAEMDAAGIDVQVLSLTSPGVEQLDAGDAVAIARESNQFIADAVRDNPSRLAGFATIPTPAPDRAADELERAVRDLGFKGAIINGHVRGRYLDEPFFWPIFERAQALRVPVYLHPTQPPQPVVEASYGRFSPAVSYMFANAGWGWHIETAIHVIRLILGGVFDRYPTLQVVVGHLGEGLPFMIERLDTMPPAMTRLERPISTYLRENLHYTFSGFNFTPTFLNLLLEVGVDRIMFSADHPYALMARARLFLDGLPVSPADRERIAHGNAEALLGL